MMNYYFDANGKYAGCAIAAPNTLSPHNAVRFPPPERPGLHPVINADKTAWKMVESAAAADRMAETSAASVDEKRFSAGRMVYLTARGTYHRTVSCGRTGGEWVSMADVSAKKTKVRPCNRCRPAGGDGAVLAGDKERKN